MPNYLRLSPTISVGANVLTQLISDRLIVIGFALNPV
jgi:hypothetical protein